MDSKKVIIRETKKYGNAVFAIDDIEAGEMIAVFDDRVYEAESALTMINEPPLYAARHAVQFEANKWRDGSVWGIARYIAHSCSPNCGIKNLFEIVAMRDIRPNEEITWDYAMTEDSDWTMRCMCNSDNCRGMVGAFSMLTEEDKKRYEGYISEWLST